MEIWKDVDGYEGKYQISNMGNVRSLNFRGTNKTKLLKPIKNKYGYMTVHLCGKWARVHRLVAKAFIPNEGDKKEVNHINGDIRDNRAENLEWCTPSENSKHAWDTGLQKMTEERKKKISRSVVCVETGVEYYGMQDASNKTNINRRNINACCLGKRQTAGGYHWKYKAGECV